MEYPIVTVAQGQLRGSSRKNLDGENFYSFLGIPYGKPPIGNLRFKAPEPAEPWIGIRDATKEGLPCIQRSEVTNIVAGSEDCLNLNVFSKKLPSESSSLKPVMVWIHGGGFITGSNSIQHYGPEHLMLEDIVLVTINYRLGLLGFLNAEDPLLQVPGNAGIKDQRLALQWVQKNIKNFNGDPDNVTVFGESAGGMSTHCLVLSSTVNGLFHKAIMQSGCLYVKSSSDGVVLEIAQLIDNNVKTESEALDILRNLSVEKLYEIQVEYLEKDPSNLPTQIIEKPNSTEIITKPIMETILSGNYNKVPLLFGYTNNEGIIENIITTKNIFGKGWDLIFQLERVCRLKEDDPKRQIVENKLKQLYSQEKYAQDKYMWTGDCLFKVPAITAAKLHTITSSEPVYLYSMSIDAGLNFWKRLYDKNHIPGASHADDLGYLFNTAFASHKLHKGELEILAVRRFVKLWTNFAKYGNPTPAGNDLNIVWKPVEDDEVHYLDIGRELIPSTNPIPDRVKVWNEVYEILASNK